MDEKLNQLVQSLRNELLQYSEMLRHLDEHYRFIMRPLRNSINEPADKIQAQAAVIRRIRQNHEQARKALARALRLDVGMPIEKLIPFLPAGNQSLVIALVRATRELLALIQESLQRNRRLLASSLTWTRLYRK